MYGSGHGPDTESIGRNQRGFALVEILVAIAVLSVGLLGLGSAMALQGGIAEGASTGAAAVNRGYYVTTATMLAQDRMEQVRRLQYVIGPPAVDQLTVPTPAGFADEAFDTIAGYGNFSRQVRVQNYPSPTAMKTVTVTVSFRRPTSTGTTVDNVTLSTTVAARP